MSDNISFSSNRNSIQKFKIVFVGEQNVGKSSIIARYIRNEFDPTKNPTIGIDFVSKNIAIAGKMVRLQLWDTAGQQRFKSLIPSYLKDAHMALVVFDLSNMGSAEVIPKWIDFIREAGKAEIKIYVVGNKCDLEAEIVNQTRKIAQQIAEKQADCYQEVSAKTSTHIEDLFNKVIEDLVSSLHKKKELTPTASSAKEIDPKQSSSVKLQSQKNQREGQAAGCCH